MIEVEVKPRKDGRWDIYVSDGGNHEPSFNTNQGYESEKRAIEVAVRHFGGRAAIRAHIPYDDRKRRGNPEPVDLIITQRDGEQTRTAIR